MIQLFTIGFTHKSAEKFFDLLLKNSIKTLIDTRIHNASQLAGFSKGRDLEYFVKTICSAKYVHMKDLAPTHELLKRYRAKELSWESYEDAYLTLIRERHVEMGLKPELLHFSCLLCSEDSPEFCHRRLLADYLFTFNPEMTITHL